MWNFALNVIDFQKGPFVDPYIKKSFEVGPGLIWSIFLNAAVHIFMQNFHSTTLMKVEKNGIPENFQHVVTSYSLFKKVKSWQYFKIEIPSFILLHMK